MILKRCKYLLSEQCPVLNLATHARCCRLLMFRYTLFSRSVCDRLLIRLSCFAVFPSFHFFSHCCCIAFLISMFLVIFIVACFGFDSDFRFSCFLAARFASTSVISLLFMSLCFDIHFIMTFMLDRFTL